MKRCTLTLDERRKVFGVHPTITDEALDQLIRLEFQLRPTTPIALTDSHGALIPMCGGAMENGETYVLTTYENRVEAAMTEVTGRVGRVLEEMPPPPPPMEEEEKKPKVEKVEKKEKATKVSMSARVPLRAGQKCDPEDEGPNWAEFKSDEGHPYWFNAVTGESTWEKPAALKSGTETDSNFQAQKFYEDEGYDPFEDDQYFDSYTDVSLQGEMVGDRSRSDSYLKAMLRYAEADFKDKVVLDCGCGTGLLSFFAIKAGAKKVYAIEGSNLAFKTREVVEANGLGDKIIVYHARMEDVELPEKVDTIVSEWMGACLIFESMLGSVLYARDRWLKPGGMLYPSRSTILFAPIEAKEYFHKKIEFWKDVYGMDMTAFLDTARETCVEKPMFDRIVDANDVLIEHADALELVHYDLQTMTIEEIERVRKNFRFVSKRDGTLHGFACWFTVDFESRAIRAVQKEVEGDEQDEAKRLALRREKVKSGVALADDASHAALLKGEVGDPLEVVVLSTAPDQVPTHWKQLSLLLDQGVPIRKGDEFVGEIDILRNTYWRRHFNFDLTYQVNGGEVASKGFGLWRQKTVQEPKPETVPPGAL